MSVLFFWAVLVLVGSAPFEKLAHDLFIHVQKAAVGIDKPYSHTEMSGAPWMVALASGLTICKGIAVVLVTRYGFGDELMMALAVTVLMGVHTWPLYTGFSTHRKHTLFLFGIYVGIHWNLGFGFLLLVAGLGLLFNSALLGLILSVFAMFFVFWMYGDLPVMLPANFVFFVLLLLAYRKEIANHLDYGAHSLLSRFSNRFSSDGL